MRLASIYIDFFLSLPANRLQCKNQEIRQKNYVDSWFDCFVSNMHDKREQQRQNERQCEPTELPQQQQKKATTTIWLLCYYFLFEDFEWIALQHFLFAESDRLELRFSWESSNAIGNRLRRRSRRRPRCCQTIRFEWLIMRIRLNAWVRQTFYSDHMLK